MSRLDLRLALCAAFLSVLAPSFASAETLVITTEEFPPLNFTKDGKVVGSSTELVEMALKETKIEGKIAVYPWARAIDMAMKEPNTCVYSTTRTAEREPNFKWAGPVANNEWILLGRADSPKLASIEDAKKYVIGGYKDDALTLHLKKEGFNVEEAPSDELNPKKLAAKRIDYWAGYKFEGADLSKDPAKANLVEAAKIKTVSMYLACNKGVSDETIAKLNASFKKMADEGTLAATVKKYN